MPHASSTSCRHALSSGIEPPNRWAGLASGAVVGAVEPDVRGGGQRPGERDHVGERHAGPCRGAGRAGPPRRLAGDVADRDEPRAPVAGALQRRGHLALAERLAQRGEREVELALDEPVDPQPPALRLELRDRAVPADVERVGRGHGPFRQRREPGLGVERLLLVHDQVGALPVAAHDRGSLRGSGR